MAQQFTPSLFRHVSNRLSHGDDDGATCCCLDLQDPEDSCAQHPWGSWKRQVQFLTLDMELLRNKLASQERITDAAAWRTAEAASPLSCLPS